MSVNETLVNNKLHLPCQLDSTCNNQQAEKSERIKRRRGFDQYFCHDICGTLVEIFALALLLSQTEKENCGGK